MRLEAKCPQRFLCGGQEWKSDAARTLEVGMKFPNVHKSEKG